MVGVTVRREKALDFSGCNSRTQTGWLRPPLPTALSDEKTATLPRLHVLSIVRVLKVTAAVFLALGTLLTMGTTLASCRLDANTVGSRSFQFSGEGLDASVFSCFRESDSLRLSHSWPTPAA